MTTQQLVECFEGTPVSQLGWLDLARYNIALTRLNMVGGVYLTGNTPGGLAQQYGITWEYRNTQGGQRNEKR